MYNPIIYYWIKAVLHYTQATLEGSGFLVFILCAP